jgi:ABC-type polysaccharide/polyol phosphate export permease
MPHIIQIVANISPLYHATELVRPLITHQPLQLVWLHLGLLLAFTVVAFIISSKMLQKRMVN